MITKERNCKWKIGIKFIVYVCSTYTISNVYRILLTYYFKKCHDMVLTILHSLKHCLIN